MALIRSLLNPDHLKFNVKTAFGLEDYVSKSTLEQAAEASC